MKYEALIFDMDGVIIDSEILFDNADTEFFKRYSKTFYREEVVPLITGMHLQAGTAFLKETYGFPGELDALVAERQALVEAEYNTHLRYMRGFEDFYAQVIAAGLKTCVATASNDYLLNIAKRKLRLDEKFGADIFKVSDVGNRSKPDPAIYLYAAEKMSVSPSACLVIEDSPKGIRAAKSARMYCIGITTTFTREKINHADLVVDSFEQIDLDNLLAAE